MEHWGFAFVILILLLCGITYSVLNNKVELEEDPLFLIPKVKRAINNPASSTTAENSELVNKYFEAESLKPILEKYKDWDKDEKSFGELCKFGIRLLETDTNESLKIVESMLIVIHKQFYKSVLLKLPNKHTATSSHISEWEFNDEIFAHLLPKFLIMYEYLGKNIKFKQYICHSIITQISKASDDSLTLKRSHADLVKVALPRLLTNYLFDKTTFKFEMNPTSRTYLALKNAITLRYNSPEKVQNGLYSDGSYIYHKDVVTYKDLVDLIGFYEKLIDVMAIKHQFREIVTPILKKLLHPTIRYTTLGIFGDSGNRRKDPNWGIDGELGIAIMPFCGLGLFKSKDFMFSLRVQKPNVAAFRTDAYGRSEFGLGWIQLRKMYLANHYYSNPLTAQKLYEQPGIISVADTEIHSPDDKLISMHCKNVKSLIGRLPNDSLMFWINEYEFTVSPGKKQKTAVRIDMRVTEMGLVTDNGVEIWYNIYNKSQISDLQFRVQDTENEDLNYEPAEKFRYIGRRKSQKFMFRMIFDEVHKIAIHEEREGEMTFTYNHKTYSVIPIDNDTYIVKVTDISNKILEVFGGDSKLRDKIKVDRYIPGITEEIVLIRNDSTYMYHCTDCKF